MKLTNLLMFFLMIAVLTSCENANVSTNNVDSSASINSDNAETTDSILKETYTSDNSNENAIKIDGESKSFENVEVRKTGDGEGGEDGDFYGLNAAVLATNKATVDIKNADIDTDASYGNAVFSYGNGTNVNISDSTINTNSRNSGGIMVTGGGTLNAKNLTINTNGGSSAAIRSDRGGGTLNVNGGTYKTYGSGSPAVYSTADITVENADLYSDIAEGVVIEGKNSVTLKNTNLVANNIKHNSDKSDVYKAVMIYQSMSGDASVGKGVFSMDGGTLESKNGCMFFVNNTVAEINLNNVHFKSATDEFLKVEKAGWGRDGSNGGQVTLNATNQNIEGNVTVDSISTLNYLLNDNSDFNGSIVSDGETYVELKNGAKWNLTADSKITSLTCDSTSINLNGHKLLVGDKEYTEGSTSTGSSIEVKNSTNSNGEDMQFEGGDKKPPMDGDKKPPMDGDKKPPMGGDRKPPEDGDRKPPED